jgi:hypothetical protein
MRDNFDEETVMIQKMGMGIGAMVVAEHLVHI